MTQKDSTNFDPKHRIIGAVIIVSLAVIFVPMILDRRAPPEASNVSDIPAPSASENKVVVTPVPPPIATRPSAEPTPDAAAPTGTARAPETVGEKTASEKPAATKPAPSKPAPKETTVAKPAAKPAPKTSETKSSAADNGWVVQVGTFANAANATRLEGQLKKQGHAVSVERVTHDGAQALRLRVGPFKDKTLALKAQGKIQKDIGVQGVVLAYP